MLGHKVLFRIKYSQKYLSEEISLMKQYHRIKADGFRPQVATRRIVEHLFFPDYSDQVQEQVLAQEGDTLDSQGVDRVMAVGAHQSTRENTHPEGLRYLLKTTQVNNRLLELFSLHQSDFGEEVTFQLVRQMLANQKGLDRIRKRHLERFEQKRKRINKLKSGGKVTLEFGQVFLTKAQLVAHPGYLGLLEHLVILTGGGSLEPVLDTLSYLFTFDNDKNRLSPIVNALFHRLDRPVEIPVSQEIQVLQVIHRLYLCKMLSREQIKSSKVVFLSISNSDLSVVSAPDVYSLVQCQRVIQPCRLPALLYRLEPYVMKHLSVYRVEEKINLLQNYLSMKEGSVPFIKMLVNHLILTQDQLTYSDCLKVFLKIRPQEGYFLMELHHLLQTASHQLIKGIQTQHPDLQTLSIIQAQFDYNQVINPSYHQFLSIMMVKLNQSHPLLGHLAQQVLHWLCFRNMHSDILLSIAQQQIAGSIQAQERIEGYISGETGETGETEASDAYGMQIDLLWNYAYQIVMSGETSKYDFELFSRQCERIKESGEVGVERRVREQVGQINAFISLYSQGMLYASLPVPPLKSGDSPAPINQEEYELVTLERQHFLLKYKSIVTEQPEGEYLFDLKVSKGDQEVLVMLDPFEDCLYQEQSRQSHKTGQQQMRQVLLAALMPNVKYIDMDYQEVLAKSVKYLQGDPSTVLQNQISNDSRIDLLEEQGTGIQLDSMMTRILQLRTELASRHPRDSLETSAAERVPVEEPEETEEDVYLDSADEDYK